MRYKQLINILKNLQFSKDTHDSHPEESVYHHSVQAFVRARKESTDKELWVAALFHDIGKTIEIHGHENLGIDILRSFGYNNEKVIWLIENHMRMHWVLSGRIKKYGKIQSILQSPWLPELVHLRRVDALGRKVGLAPWISTTEINFLLEITNGDM